MAKDTSADAVSAVTPPDDEPALLLALAFSDCALWYNTGLRDPHRDGCPFVSSLHFSIRY